MASAVAVSGIVTPTVTSSIRAALSVGKPIVSGVSLSAMAAPAGFSRTRTRRATLVFRCGLGSRARLDGPFVGTCTSGGTSIA